MSGLFGHFAPNIFTGRKKFAVCLGLLSIVLLIPLLKYYNDVEVRHEQHGYQQSILNITKRGKGFRSTKLSRPEKIKSKTTVGRVSPTIDTYRPKILVWSQPYKKVEYTLPDLPGDSGGCDIIWNREDYTKSDAVVFFMKSCETKDLPPPELRRANQSFVWWSLESPWTVLHIYGHRLTDFNNYFNWTMAYRTDSDIVAQMAPITTLDYMLYKLHREDEMKDKELMRHPVMSESQFKSEINRLMSHKSKFASWVVSDCDFTNGAKKRYQIMKDIKGKGGMNIDEYGKCSNNLIADNYTILFETLSPYKFYFAFENTYHCIDYFTEKLYYNGFIAGTVPIVYGAIKSDLEKVVPPGSFIFYEDFKDIEEFAKYLKYLDSNDEAYAKYFEWWKSPGAHTIPRYGFNYGSNPRTSGGPSDRKKWTFAVQDDTRDYHRIGFHHLCRKLRAKDHVHTSKTVPDMNKWWYGPESKDCVVL